MAVRRCANVALVETAVGAGVPSGMAVTARGRAGGRRGRSLGHSSGRAWRGCAMRLARLSCVADRPLRATSGRLPRLHPRAAHRLHAEAARLAHDHPEERRRHVRAGFEHARAVPHHPCSIKPTLRAHAGDVAVPLSRRTLCPCLGRHGTGDVLTPQAAAHGQAKVWMLPAPLEGYVATGMDR